MVRFTAVYCLVMYDILLADSVNLHIYKLLLLYRLVSSII